MPPFGGPSFSFPFPSFILLRIWVIIFTVRLCPAARARCCICVRALTCLIALAFPYAFGLSAALVSDAPACCGKCCCPAPSHHDSSSRNARAYHCAGSADPQHSCTMRSCDQQDREVVAPHPYVPPPVSAASFRVPIAALVIQAVFGAEQFSPVPFPPPPRVAFR
jgi:hypothetical protein